MVTKTPENLTITSRNIHFATADSASRWWHAGDPVATAFSNALSASFPQGERFFIEAVKRYRNHADAKLQAQIDTFVRQESLHTREHLAFNNIMMERGYDLTRIDAFIRKRLEEARRRPPLVQLAATVALEHYTAILAHALLEDPTYLMGVPEPIEHLWKWHAIEEIEHKAVAFDTFLAATARRSGLRRWLLRCYVMTVITTLFLNEIFFSAGEFFRQDGIARPRTWLAFLRHLFVRPGIFRRVLGSYLAFYRPGFHPWFVDDRGLVRGYEPALAL